MRHALGMLLVLTGCQGVTGGVGDGAAPQDLAMSTDATMLGDGPLPVDLAGDGAVASFGPYDTDGTDTVTKFDMLVETNVVVHVYLPGSAGTHPIVVLAPGTAQPGSAYAGYGERLASHGVVALITDDPGALTDTSVVVASLTYIIGTWLPTQTSTGMLGGHIDPAKVGLAGHSRGGKASLLAAEGLPGMVKGWVGIDPVDSAILGNGNLAVTNIATVGVPLLFLGGGVTTLCSPASSNYEVLYAASVAPSVALTFVGASHTEFEEPAACLACSLCTPMGTADASQVLSESIRYLAAFFGRELSGDTSVGAGLDGAGVSIDVAASRIQRAVK